MEADRIAAPFQHRTLEIVVEQHARHAAPGGECADMAAQEALHPRVQEEAQEDLPRVAQHHDERHQRTPCPANLQMTEVPPVHLRLLARQAAQPQIGLGRTARPVQRNQVAEVIGAAAIAALIAPSRTGGWRSGLGTSPASRGSAAGRDRSVTAAV